MFVYLDTDCLLDDTEVSDTQNVLQEPLLLALPLNHVLLYADHCCVNTLELKCKWQHDNRIFFADICPRILPVFVFSGL